MSIKRNFSFIILLLIFRTGIVKAQTQLPNVLPPSPAAANFLRYGEIPIDYSTGVPNISIPLYTVKGHKLELPLSISYHASGIKVEDKASTIGLGWVLNAGGLINQTILGNGTDSQTFQPTFKTSASFEHARDSAQALDSVICDISHLSNFGGIIWNQLTSTDWESDRYSYQLPNGQSGTFRYGYLTGSLVKMPYNGLKIQKILNLKAIIGFILTDEEGVTYTYGVPSNWISVPAGVTNFDLLSMVSADKTDTIRFVYKNEGNVYVEQSCNSMLEGGGLPNNDGHNIYYTNMLTFSNSYSITRSAERVLDSIISSEAIVKFTDINDRRDMAEGFDSFRVTNLSVYARSNGQLIKSYNFGQSYFGGVLQSNNLRLRLDSVTVSGNNATTVEKYKFKYITYKELPPYPETQVPSNYPIDYWGYYNGAGGTSLLPDYLIPDSVDASSFGNPAYPTAPMYGYRMPDSNYSKAAMLQEIDYPTGGATIFTFEPNQSSVAYYYGDPPNNANIVGGWRIKNISNYTDSGVLANYKTYKYSDGQTLTFTNDLFGYEYRVMYQSYPTAWSIINSTPYMPLKADNGPPVFYPVVTEYVGDTYTNQGATEYDYITPPVAYHPATSNPPFDGPMFQDPFDLDMGEYIPQLQSKIIYKNINGVYIPVSRTNNTYSSFLPDQYYTGMHTATTTFYPNGVSDMGWDYHWCAGGTIPPPFTNTLGYPYYIIPYDLHATQQVNLVTQTQNIDYSPDGTQSVTGTTNYTYGDLASYTYGKAAHTRPTEKDFIDSKGDTLKTIYKFPDNFTGTSPYDSMLSLNILTPTIEQDSYKNSYFLQSQKTNYFNWGNNLIAPQTVQTQTLNNAADTRIQFYAYDPRGNLASVSKQNDIKITYLWNYNNSYPVAQVTNADTGSIAYTSFEGDDKGKWSFSSAPVSSAAALTGTMIYTLNGSNSITRAGLSSGATYIVSYWSSGSSYTVTGSTAVKQGKTITIGGTSWTYYEHTVTGASSITVSGSGNIDELRLYPKDAQMKTYAYLPLVGVTAECDIDDRVTYYGYDAFGRLAVVKDQDGNIIKTVNYHYQGQ